MNPHDFTMLRPGDHVLLAQSAGKRVEPARRVAQVIDLRFGAQAPIPGGHPAVGVRVLVSERRRLCYAFHVNRKAHANEVHRAMVERERRELKRAG